MDYESVGSEVILNVYQTLVTYNGSSTANYVPELSKCVPGPAASGPTSCQSQYGNDLKVGNYWTFPIDSAARFYDPGTGASWGVYPSDVMFSIARTLMWLETPSQYSYNGWILGQSLLPFGNGAWDGAVHIPWNNTPQHILNAMLVNDSAYCPAAAMTSGHGCITFDANGSGAVWPEFLQFVADAQGGSVVPCGWFTAQNATVPGFSSNAANGDGPCTLPGGVTSTNTSAFKSYVDAASPILYDSTILLGDNYYAPQPGVRWNTTGSGPYYVDFVNTSVGYTLKANPAYQQPTGCLGVGGGCEPAAGRYLSTVQVYWEPNDTVGLSEYGAGQADAATISPVDLPVGLNLQSEGKIGFLTIPTLNLFPEGFAYQFDPSATQTDSGLTTNIPANFFSYVGMREFLAQSFPYNSFITQYNTVDGQPFIEGVGGAIPQGLGNYYPTNISWPGLNTTTGAWMNPNTNPSTPGSAAWWWAQITNPSSPYYDPEAVACQSVTCNFPLVSEQGATAFDQGIDAWNQIVNTITGGALQPSRWDPTFTELITLCLGSSPGTGACTSSVDGWLPDYPDPTDYMTPFYLPDGSYTYTPALNETFVGQDFGGSYNGCSTHDADTFANLVYWANVPSTTAVIPNGCQGTAYSVMTWASTQAASMPVGPERVLYYNLLEHVANGLALYVYADQPVTSYSYAVWVNPARINTNVMIGGTGEQTWYLWGNRYVNTVNFTENGLAAGTTWSVGLHGTNESSNASSIVFAETNGTYSYNVTAPIGYTGSPLSGSVVVTGAGQAVAVTMTPVAPGGVAAIAELFTVYNDRPDLQAAFPDVSSNLTSYLGLVNWAGGVVTGEWTDSARTQLAPFGYYYALMLVYDGRSDLQAAFPDAFTSLGSYTLLVNWAGGVATGAWTDSASLTLAPFGYYYALILVYDGRSDLQAAFPDALTSLANFTQLVNWAGNVVNGTISDSAASTLTPFGYYYALMMIYDSRSDLQAAYPSSFTDGTSYQGLLTWAKGVVTGAYEDSAYSTLEPFAASYIALG
ncbi:MAG: hypothetical protein WB786_08340 [Thermoplasmata archaeon]